MNDAKLYLISPSYGGGADCSPDCDLGARLRARPQNVDPDPPISLVSPMASQHRRAASLAQSGDQGAVGNKDWARLRGTVAPRCHAASKA